MTTDTQRLYPDLNMKFQCKLEELVRGGRARMLENFFKNIHYQSTIHQCGHIVSQQSRVEIQIGLCDIVSKVAIYLFWLPKFDLISSNLMKRYADCY